MNRKLLFSSGIVIFLVTFFLVIIFWEDAMRWYSFSALFDVVDKNEDGSQIYVHKQSGIIVHQSPNGPLLKFKGTVNGNKKWEQVLLSDLYFELRPIGKGKDNGWVIWLGTAKQTENNYANPVTLPFRGVRSIDIIGWHFVNSDFSGPNRLGPKNVNSPGPIRHFFFVLNLKDYKAATIAMKRALWPGDETAGQQTIQSMDVLAKGRGVFKIVQLDMGDSYELKTPRIESMQFEVELLFPDNMTIESLFLN